MSLKSLINAGTKICLDGMEPDDIEKNRYWGRSGTRSAPTVQSRWRRLLKKDIRQPNISGEKRGSRHTFTAYHHN
jgi:hypothetical protein